MPVQSYADQFTTGIIVTGSPIAWLFSLYFDSEEGEDVIKIATGADYDTAPSTGVRLLFNSNAKASYKIPLTAAETSTEYIEVGAADGGKVKFPKKYRDVDGVLGTKITDPTQDENATGKCEITIDVPKADVDSTSWGAFINKIITTKDAYWLLIMPLGFN